MRQAGHSHQNQDLQAKKLGVWEQTHGYPSKGRPTPTLKDVLKKEALTESRKELVRCMENQDDWRVRLRMT